MSDSELRVLCSNVRGLINNWSSATNFKWDDYDLLGFNEIWGIKEFENLKVTGFKVISCRQRRERRGGGSIIFGKENLNVKVLNTPFIEGVIESTGIRVNGVTFVNIYRPPSGNKTEFVDTLTQYLDTIRGSKILIGGDFNLDTMGSNIFMNNICSLYNLEIKINEITRIVSGTCIDNYLTNIRGEYKVSDLCIADHQAIVARVQCEDQNNLSPVTFTYREMKEYNWLCFKAGINTINLRGNCINDRWSNLLDDIKLVVETSFPERTKKNKYVFTMSQGLLKSKDKKNKLLSQYKRGQIDKEIYVRYNKIYRKLIWEEQNKKFEEKIIEAGGSGKKKWKVLKDKLFLQKEISKITEICENGTFLTDEVEISHAFRDHFETCAARLAEGLPPGEDTSVVMPQGSEWSLECVNEQTIINIIKSLKNKNSSGYDCLSNRMLKHEPHAFARLIVDLINESITSGNFPDCLKTAKVIPIYKKGDRTNLNNYRPISLLPVLSKVFEKVVNSQLNGIIDVDFIDENQFGFRNNHSTEDAVLKFVNKIEKDLSSKLHVATVYVDVSKAFDSCDHSILLSKIKRTGLNQTGLNFFKNYLLDRKQMVSVNGFNGGTFVINIGVGQGTVLGPTLFKIYIMDMHLCTNLFCVKFADDSSFEAAGRSREELEDKVNSELIKIASWFKSNRLTLHPDKSRVIIHSRDKLINIKLDNIPIQRCGYGLQEESVKLLGIHIDENLDYMHTNERLKSNGLLTLKDEINIQESKWLFKWNTRTLPTSLIPILEEKNDRLRGRRFKIDRNLKNNSIGIRLTKQANKNIQKITAYKSVNCLTHGMKSEALVSYDIPCRTRNCFICVNRF